MYRYVFEDSNGNKWERVNATQARNAFMRGETVVMCTANMRPFGPWGYGSTVCLCDERYPEEAKNPASVWERLVNSYTYYNCSHPGEARYLAYYLQK